MRRRFAEKKPVMWYRASVLFLFVEEGVYQSTTYFCPTEFKKPVWTLVDSDDSPDGTLQ